MFFLLFYLFRHEISELPRPIAVKLCHMITIWVRFITQVQKFGGPLPKEIGAKTCKIWANFIQLQTSKISPERDKISKIGMTCDHQRFLRRSTYEKSGELWSTNYRVLHVSLDPPKFFGRLYFGRYGVLAPQILTRTTD